MSIGAQDDPYGSYVMQYNIPSSADISGIVTSSTTAIAGITPSPALAGSTSAVYSFSWVGTGSQYYAVAYSPATSADTTITFSSPLYAFIGTTFAAQNTATQTFTVSAQWLRTRAYPPSGVMPSVTFGAVQSASASLTISPNPATYGKNITITATCPVSTNSCAIDYPSLGTTLASGTGSATYTYNAFVLGVGTYSSFYANDITLGTNSIGQTLTVNKVSVSPSCSFAVIFTD